MNNSTTIPTGYQYNLYGYDPSETGAIISAILFGILGIAVFGINWRHKSWFLISIPIASLMEVIGFAVRPNAAYSVSQYIVTVLMILLAPTVFAMADYALISRIMIKTKVEHPIFKPNVVRWMFLSVDIASFFIQVSGGGLTAISDRNLALMGSKILLAGLAIGLCVFVFFLFMLIYIYLHMKPQEGKEAEFTACRVMMALMFVHMLLLIIRSTFRVAEYGNLEFHNPISTNEGLFYGCDVAMMMLLNALWVPFHPGFWGILKETTNTKETKMVPTYHP